MNFGSAYALAAHSDEESYDEEELAYSDDDEVDRDVDDDYAKAVLEKESSTKPKSRKVRKADTNVISVTFGALSKDSSKLITGDASFCQTCKAILNAKSTLFTTEATKVWGCEFCGTKNELMLDDEEIPKDPIVDFLLETPTEVKTTDDDSLIVFCIDISGSMGVTTEVDGKLNLRGNSEREIKLQQLNTERGEQYMPREKRNVTYISRLQCVQAAIERQIQLMERENPNRKVGIVTFNNDVTIIGDGNISPVIITGDRLHNHDALTQLGSSVHLSKRIKDTSSLLSKKLFQLEESGSTALGPALVVSVAMASHQMGSKVIICTDGLANVGLGDQDGIETVEDQERVASFYHQTADLARSKGVNISVITISGTECRMENLGILADKTGGQMNIVDPLKLTTEFDSILADEVIATHVTASLVLHKAFYIRERDEESSTYVKDIGNVTKDSEITFEYGMKHDAQVEADTVPFQVQITFRKRNGMKCMRVITEMKPVTKDRQEAEKESSLAVLGRAQLAMDGEYSMARVQTFAHKQLLKKAANTSEENQTVYTNWKKEMKRFDTELASAKRKEAKRGMNLSDDEASDDESAEEEEEPKAKTVQFSSSTKKESKEEAKEDKKKKERSGKKTITTVEGLAGEEAKSILSDVKKQFCCNGSLQQDEKLGTVVQLSGDQRKALADYLVAKRKHKKENIKIHGF